MRTPQQERDFQFINHLWSIFRDFGDLKNDDSDYNRWVALFDREREIRKDFDDAVSRRALGLALTILECRSRNDYKWIENKDRIYYIVHGTEDIYDAQGQLVQGSINKDC